MKKYTQEELKEILEKHKLWLENKTKGEKAILIEADLSGADLREANLSRAYLGGADLREAILSGADLSGANLSEAILSRADLSGAYLNGAILSGANLSGADLREAILSGAYLNGAILSGANLSGADLREAILSGTDLNGANLSHTIVNSFTLGKHFGYSWKNKKGKIIVKIGCEEHEIHYWKKHIVEIGNKHRYSDKEIEVYSAQLKLLRIQYKKGNI
jgi:hypothetical protein